MKKNPRSVEGQLYLFDSDEVAPEPPPAASKVALAAVPGEIVELAGRLPPALWLGTSSWSFPGWGGLVYAQNYAESRLAKHGLATYSLYPLFRAVGLDRGYYAPIPGETYRNYAASVPDDFRFLVKAPESLTLQRFSLHPRYGAMGGELNPQFLSTEVALRDLVEPAREGLGGKLGCLLFQFPPQGLRDLGGSRSFAARLYQFLESLPRGVNYAVEIRNRELFCPEYRDVLERLGAGHCLNIHPQMVDFNRQLEAVENSPFCVVRWMLNPRAENYENAVDLFEPFDRLQMEDLPTRVKLAGLCRRRGQAGLPTLVIINNKAEGCSPLSVGALARSIASGDVG